MTIYRRIEVLTRLATELSRARGDARVVLETLAHGLRDYMGWPVDGFTPVREGEGAFKLDEDGSAYGDVEVSVHAHVVRIGMRVMVNRDNRAAIEIAERNWSITLSHAGSLQQVYEEAADKLQHLFHEAAWSLGESS